MRKLMLLFLFTVFSVGSVMANGMFEVRADTNRTKQTLSDGMINVAFVVSEDLVLMDLAGPWIVFRNAGVRVSDGKRVWPYELYTVAASTEPIHASGALTIIPNYTFEKAPTPDIVVVGAQNGASKLTQWLKKVHKQGSTIMSVCTGAFHLANTGLLAGKKATTHHGYLGIFSRQFPDIKVIKEVRYVKASPTLFTSAGVTSGIDLALHMVAERFGQKVAQHIAYFMEYQGTGWKTNQGISVLKAPIKHKMFSGKLPSGASVTLDFMIRGHSPAGVTTDLPAWNVTDAQTKVKQKGRHFRFSFPADEETATYTGRVERDENGNLRIVGTLIYKSKSYPLILQLKSQSITYKNN